MSRAATPSGGPPAYGHGPPIADAASLAHALARLRALDPEVVDRLLAVGGPPALRRRHAGFASLVGIIVSQQVSTASAAAIFARVEARFNPLSAAAVLAIGEGELGGLGLSGAKARAVRAAATAIVEGRLDLASLSALPAEAAHARLVAIKGIGPWTADVVLLTCLGHPDAWPEGDIALQEAARLALDLPARPDALGLRAIGERWRPHRAVAARLLWGYYRAKKGRDAFSLPAPADAGA